MSEKRDFKVSWSVLGCDVVEILQRIFHWSSLEDFEIVLGDLWGQRSCKLEVIINKSNREQRRAGQRKIVLFFFFTSLTSLPPVLPSPSATVQFNSSSPLTSLTSSAVADLPTFMSGFSCSHEGGGCCALAYFSCSEFPRFQRSTQPNRNEDILPQPEEDRGVQSK